MPSILMRSRLTLASAALALAAASAAAEPFACPTTGGELIFALEAQVPGLDWHVSNATATRNVALHIFESLMTRDDNMNPIFQLAEDVAVSDDGLTYTFTLRDGVTFHNGKTMTSADVVASFNRYREVGVDRGILEPVEGWEAPDARTFVLRLKEPRPLFLEALSVFTVPISIIPAEYESAPPQQLPIIGTGPYKLDELRADSFVRLVRHDGYRPDERFETMTGMGGRRVACLDAITFRMMTEAAARTAALEVGEVHGVEDVPAASVARIEADPNLTVTKRDAFWMNVFYPNHSAPPTDNLKVRQAMLAALDFDEIMDAATEGNYKLNMGFQFPGQLYYTEEGSELLNQADPERARALLAEAGYDGTPIVLLTNRQFPIMYNTSLVMAEQLKAAGMNAELLVLDWPAALAKSQQETTGWNVFHTGWITVIALGGPQTLRQMAEPNPVHKPVDLKVDPEFMAAFREVQTAPELADRQAAFARAQRRALETVMAVPLGVAPKVQAVRSNVKGFSTYYNTRLTNVWLEN